MVTNTNDEKTKTGQLPSDRILMVTAPRFQNCWGHHIEAMISQSCIKRIIRVWSITNQKELSISSNDQHINSKFSILGIVFYHIYRIYIIKLIIISINIHHIYTIYCSGTEYFLSRDRLFTAPGQSIFCSGTDYLLLRDRVFSAPGQRVLLGCTHRREWKRERWIWESVSAAPPALFFNRINNNNNNNNNNHNNNMIRTWKYDN